MSSISPLSLANGEFYPGQSGTVELVAGQLPSGNPVSIRAHVFRSFRPGPTILFLAGVHGDEINGVEILRRSLRVKLFEKLIAGTVVVVPLLNVYGFNNFSRDVPDGKDVNRSFPGTSSGSLASRIAAGLSKNLLAHCDLAVDFHTGGRGLFNYPQIRYSPDDPEASKAARQFNPPVMLSAKPPSKSLRRSAFKSLGLSVLTFEGGENLRYDGPSIQEGISGIKRLLYARDMLNRPATGLTEREPVELFASSWVRAGRAGLFQWSKRSGYPVRKGEPIGVIHDPHGIRPNKRILSPRSGFIIGHTNSAVVSQGDALFHIGF
ncbi:succinylglutamate desuccinylase/aspartoacylase family protein [Neolewinella litorea]|uniref:Succinylglutamate desuccinylase/aspartoacylase family protein n=1 Tax=Neolewinella litorea TaxID=2562452 RepID=A0A4S4NQT1_9BACT|nr:succinylglutamate desuccinylase/aspartoacylase family protein [Neolewinella litorea]THH41525.1 succinylglutamate desuccinylase/aspartoacylase family protein [Neolewinella litorea]